MPESKFSVGQQLQVTTTHSRWVDDPDRPGQQHARIRVFEDVSTTVEVVKVAAKYVYVKGLLRTTFDKVPFDKITGESKKGSYYGGALLERPQDYLDRKVRARSKQAALKAMRAAIDGYGAERRRFQEEVGTAQYDAIVLALGEWKLTPAQWGLLGEIQQRLTAEEQEVFETLLDYLPNEVKEA